jgi:hypothetical protein
MMNCSKRPEAVPILMNFCPDQGYPLLRKVFWRKVLDIYATSID